MPWGVVGTGLEFELTAQLDIVLFQDLYMKFRIRPSSRFETLVL